MFKTRLPSLRHWHGNRPVNRKLQQRFTGHVYLIAARYYLDGCSSSGANTCTDGRAFTSAGDCANHCAHGCATANFFRGIRATRLA